MVNTLVSVFGKADIVKLDFDNIPLTEMVNFKGGQKTMRARIFEDERNRIMLISLEPGASIGPHSHKSSSEIVYILAGQGLVQLEGAPSERLEAGTVHYCPRGGTHSFINDGSEELRCLAVIPQQ